MFRKFFKLIAPLALSAICGLAIAQPVPIGKIDRVVRENNQWSITGWACQPGLGTRIDINVYVGEARWGLGPWNTAEAAEPAVHTACGTSPSSGILYRFRIPYTGPISGQSIRIDAIGTATTAPIQGSDAFGFPQVNPESVIAAASRILLLVAHEDDEIVFS